MLGAVTDHTGQPELWRRYLAVLLDGLRARPENTSMAALAVSDAAFEEAVVSSSTRSAGATTHSL
jgi:hypothetical protein